MTDWYPVIKLIIFIALGISALYLGWRASKDSDKPDD